MQLAAALLAATLASSVNAFDRHAIGNHDDLADAVSTITVGLALAVPPALDAWAIGRGRALTADLVVFGEVILVNGALVQIAKYSAQRPLPRPPALRLVPLRGGLALAGRF